VSHRGGSLVETIVRSLPIKDTHLEQIVEDIVCHLLLVQHQKIVMGPDHIRPEDVVIVKVKETVSLPPFLNHKLINTFLSPEVNTVGALAKDLEVLFRCCRSWQHHSILTSFAEW